MNQLFQDDHYEDFRFMMLKDEKNVNNYGLLLTYLLLYEIYRKQVVA